MAGLDPAIHVFVLGRFKTWMPGTSPGMTNVGAFKKSGVLLFKPLLDEVEARIDQFTLQEEQRRPVIEFEVVERIGEDLGHPDQTRLDVADEEQVNRPEQ